MSRLGFSLVNIMGITGTYSPIRISKGAKKTIQKQFDKTDRPEVQLRTQQSQEKLLTVKQVADRVKNPTRSTRGLVKTSPSCPDSGLLLVLR